MNFLSIAVTLLTLLLSVYFIGKTKNEFTGIFYRIMGYGIMLFAGGLLIVQLAGGISGRWHGKKGHHGHGSVDCNHNGDAFTGKHKNCNNCSECLSKDKKVKRKNKKGKKRSNNDSTDVFFESTIDTIDGKIIKKEIEIIKKVE